jgi:UDP-N-acetylmuramoyl-tripeptide--D-alanyl-D-alanine ligase
MRAQVLQFGGITLVNDAYNSNPHSAQAAIEVLESLPCEGRRVAVFGEMCELGEHAPRLHRQVAERLRSGRIAHVVLVGRAGELMRDALDSGGSLFGPSVACAASVDQGVQQVAEFVRPRDVVLLKASRAVGLDRLVEPLRSRLCPAE